MPDTILAVRVFKGESTADIEAKNCKFMRTGFTTITDATMDMIQVIPGIWYMLDSSKSVIPIIELPIFIPMPAVIQIAYELPF